MEEADGLNAIEKGADDLQVEKSKTKSKVCRRSRSKKYGVKPVNR